MRKSPRGPHSGGTFGRFTPGFWRPDKPTGQPIDDVGPKPERLAYEALSETDRRARDPRTAENLRAKQNALAPRRWSPTE